jgi:hypothetical protein
MILASDNPPPADKIEVWLAVNTPDRQKYEQARARYRAAKSQDKTLPESPKADGCDQSNAPTPREEQI